jgi:hypothetical protein
VRVRRAVVPEAAGQRAVDAEAHHADGADHASVGLLVLGRVGDAIHGRDHERHCHPPDDHDVEKGTDRLDAVEAEGVQGGGVVLADVQRPERDHVGERVRQHVKRLRVESGGIEDNATPEVQPRRSEAKSDRQPELVPRLPQLGGEAAACAPTRDGGEGLVLGAAPRRLDLETPTTTGAHAVLRAVVTARGRATAPAAEVLAGISRRGRHARRRRALNIRSAPASYAAVPAVGARGTGTPLPPPCRGREAAAAMAMATTIVTACICEHDSARGQDADVALPRDVACATRIGARSATSNWPEVHEPAYSWARGGGGDDQALLLQLSCWSGRGGGEADQVACTCGGDKWHLRVRRPL